jgi:predicted phosphodiesterase
LIRFAVFSDIHANRMALEAFTRAVAGQVDGYICLGDIVGYGPHNDECLEMIHALPKVAVLKGNHEEIFSTGDTSQCSELAKEFYQVSRTFFTRTDLIPTLASIEIGAWTFCHTFRKEKQWIYVYNESRVPEEIKKNTFIGHTHHQRELVVKDCHIINCGSVGQNRSNPALANFGIIDFPSGHYELRSCEYPLGVFASELIQKGYPEYLVNYYTRPHRSQPEDL